jgi:hypothetical protein
MLPPAVFVLIGKSPGGFAFPIVKALVTGDPIDAFLNPLIVEQSQTDEAVDHVPGEARDDAIRVSTGIGISMKGEPAAFAMLRPGKKEFAGGLDPGIVTGSTHFSEEDHGPNGAFVLGINIKILRFAPIATGLLFGKDLFDQDRVGIHEFTLSH